MTNLREFSRHINWSKPLLTPMKNLLQAPWSGITTHHSTSPFVEDMYDRMREMLNEYEVVVNRWPQYALVLENVSRTGLEAVTFQINDCILLLLNMIGFKNYCLPMYRQ